MHLGEAACGLSPGNGGTRLVTDYGSPLELWGGLECSVVRLGETWRDQVRDTGHHDRSGDLFQVAALGIRTMRYPILWERCTEEHAAYCGWDWHTERLGTLERLGIVLIAGLLHHGAGPLPGGLLDPAFPDGLARHAGQAAARFPGVKWWTPVNEPLTTARFSCLYGHWHPHLQDEATFLRAVVAQCWAALLAMRAIRARSKTARFVHTEDLGRTFSTPRLRAQAEYENDRRWLSLDLLCGHMDRQHPWRGMLERAGVPVRHLDELAEGEAAPDLLGINHYATSDRYLDHRTALYPPQCRGSNGTLTYADTEAVRVVLPEDVTGWAARLREAWVRYGRPIAVTEAHLGCKDTEDQVRWLMEAWQAAHTLRAEGADIRAVTAWALFGLQDWNSMLRRHEKCYEPGAFDAGLMPPRPTLLAQAVRGLAQHGRFDHPALQGPGWWRREDRVHARVRRA